MKTKSLTVRTREETDWGGQKISGASQSTNPMSDCYRMANREWYPGLCTTCVNEADCTFPRSVDRPVTTCDEFEGVVAAPAPVSVVRQDGRERWEMANHEWYPGLCSICEKRETCTYPKPKEGVFHCEEYE